MLTTYKFVTKAGFSRLPAGEIQEKLSTPSSALSHHIASLVSAGLTSQRREGKTLFCIAEYDTFEAVICFLKDEYCVNDTINQSQYQKAPITEFNPVSF